MSLAEPDRPLCKRWVRMLQTASVAPDLRDKTLASMMNVAPRTVRTYWQGLYDFTGIRDRGVLLRKAEKEVWFPPLGAEDDA